MFQELGTLIQAQGEMLDNIEKNLEEAEDYMEKAESNLETAQEINKENRKVSLDRDISESVRNSHLLDDHGTGYLSGYQTEELTVRSDSSFPLFLEILI